MESLTKNVDTQTILELVKKQRGYIEVQHTKNLPTLSTSTLEAVILKILKTHKIELEKYVWKLAGWRKKNLLTTTIQQIYKNLITLIFSIKIV